MERGEITHNISNLKNLVLRNLRYKYASTALGFLWAGFIPLILMAAIVFAFMKVLKIGGSNFHIFVLSGILPWIYFTNTVMESTQAYVRDRSLMHQFAFSKLLYPLAITFSNLVQHIIALVFLFPFFIFYNNALFYKCLFLIIPILYLTIFLSAVSILISVINIYLRDLEHFLGIFLMILFWITPVFYQPQMVPLNYRFIFYLNPLVYFIELYRSILLKNYTLFLNPVFLIPLLFVFSILFLVLVYLFYKKLENSLAKKI